MSESHQPKFLHVSSNGASVGLLADQSGQFSFEYSQQWLAKERAFPIAPSFPLSASIFRDSKEAPRVRWFFDNLLQEENERRLFATLSECAIEDSWTMLQLGGGETAGALELHLPSSIEEKPKLVPRSVDDLDNRIRGNSQVSMQSGAPKLIAIAGAQSKLAANLIGDAFFEPAGSQHSTHILKPDSKSNYYPHTAANEYFCMKLAAAVKITVPSVSLHRMPTPVFAVERFDRENKDGRWTARHIIDGTQMLGLGSHHKYEMMTARMLKQCCELCVDPIATARDIFRWAVLNVLVGNSDAHLKNISFFVDHDGITLAPFYDLVSTAAYSTPDNWPFGPHWPEIKLSMQIGKAVRYQEITRNDFLEFGSALGLSVTQAELQLDAMVLGVQWHADQIIEEAPATASERRLLNLIRHLPIREMSRKLEPEGR